MENTDILNKYQNGKIYKITDNAYTEQYIGSTVQPLASRMSGHRRNYEDYRNGKYAHVSVFDLFDKYSLGNCKIELIEHYSCKDKEELRQREGYWIKLEECVNKRIAGRTKKEQLVEYRPVYYERNKERLKEKARAHREMYYRDYRNEKIECQHCNLIINRSSMRMHIKRHHPETSP